MSEFRGLYWLSSEEHTFVICQNRPFQGAFMSVSAISLTIRCEHLRGKEILDGAGDASLLTKVTSLRPQRGVRAHLRASGFCTMSSAFVRSTAGHTSAFGACRSLRTCVVASTSDGESSCRTSVAALADSVCIDGGG